MAPLLKDGTVRCAFFCLLEQKDFFLLWNFSSRYWNTEMDTISDDQKFQTKSLSPVQLKPPNEWHSFQRVSHHVTHTAN